MPREEIGELTDWHVWELYIKPALRKAGKKAGKGGKKRKLRLPTRDEFIATGVHLGGNPDALGRQYDEWAASDEGRRLLDGRDA